MHRLRAGIVVPAPCYAAVTTRKNRNVPSGVAAFRTHHEAGHRHDARIRPGCDHPSHCTTSSIGTTKRRKSAPVRPCHALAATLRYESSPCLYPRAHTHQEGDTR